MVSRGIFSNSFYELLKTGSSEQLSAMLKDADLQSMLAAHERSLLHLSAAFGNVELTNHLVASGYIVDDKDDEGNTPLILATYFQHPKVISILLDAGADLTSLNLDAKSALYYAVLDDNKDVMKIIKSGLKSYPRLSRPLIMGQQLQAKWHRSSTTAFNKYFENELFTYTNKLRMSRVYRTDTSFRTGASIEPFFLKKIFCGDSKHIDFSLKYGADPLEKDVNGCGALHVAALSDVKADETIEQLVRLGVEIDARASRGVTPLHIASAFCNANFVKSLLERGADVNAKDDLGRAPLDFALIDSDRPPMYRDKTVKALLEYGANVDSKPEGQPTILERATRITNYQQNTNISQLLLSHLARLEAMGSALSKQNQRVIDRIIDFGYYFEACRKEIQSMKECKVLGKVFMYNILTDNVCKVAVYTRNKNFVEAFTKVNLRRKFPCYDELLQRNFDKAYEITNLTTEASPVLYNCMPAYYNFDDLVIRNILSYLDTSSLRRLCE